MTNSQRKRKHCAEYKPASDGVKTPAGFFCCHAHAVEFAIAKSQASAKRKAAASRKAQEADRKMAKEANRKRKNELNRTAHLDKLQDLVNQWVVHVRDKDQPCCTCGTTNPLIKYDCGHFLSRGARPDLRFELTNMHRQCSTVCNVYGSGKRAEYTEFIRNKYGQEHLDWLNGPHPLLKDQLPDADAIDAEIAKWRKKLREAGLKPCR